MAGVGQMFVRRRSSDRQQGTLRQVAEHSEMCITLALVQQCVFVPLAFCVNAM
jgi:hypothetical protein